jgi:CDP-glycerol glycerophosphotransferase (TagB/SpsB family)
MGLRDRFRRLRRTQTTVVVTVGPRQESSLTACLERLAGDRELEVLIAPWGSAQVPQAADVLPPQEGANAARNAALPHVGGETVVFLEATDLPDLDALSALPAKLGDRDVVRAGRQAHRLGNHLWRTSAVPTFDPRAGRHPQGSLPDDVAVVHPRGLVPGADRSWAVQFGTTPPAAAELAALLVALRETRARGWFPAFVAEVLPPFLDDLDNAAPAERDALAALLAGYDARHLGELDAETRLRAWLVGQGRADDAAAFHASRWRTDGQAPTRLAGEELLLDLPMPGEQPPTWVVRLPTDLEAHLHRVDLTGELPRLTVFSGIRWLDLSGRTPEVTARLVHESGEVVDLDVTPRPDPEATRTFAQGFQRHDAGAVQIALDLSRLTRPGVWRLLVRMRVDGLDREAAVDRREPRGSAGVDWALGPDNSTQFDREGFAVVVGRSLPAAPTPDLPTATGVRVEGRRLTVSGTGAPDGLTLVCGPWRIGGELAVTPDGFTAVFPLEHDPWGLGVRGVPTGTHHLEVRSGRRTADLPIAREVTALTPLESRTHDYAVRITRGLRDQLLVVLRPPLADDEAGRWAQHQLRAAYLAPTAPLDHDLVLLESYAGSGATDSPRAILAELVRRQPGRRYLWTVADAAVLPPPGAEPVLLRSQEWYAALATAGTIVSNVEMEWWFRTRPGQTLMLTFHGYPAKSMGIDLWRSKNTPPRRIEQMLLQTSGQWSVGLTPAPEMDRLYREQFRFEGPLLNRGYPRDDVLVGPDADRIRREARARLGIVDGQVAVLYAPTWRDDLATNFRVAAMPTHLDVAQAAAALGDDHVLLLRGHRFNTPPGTSGRAQVVDVTTYPEINDLILAADIAVLDYSSLRFDWALTGRPSVFLVPDLERYSGAGRGFLFPFEESAPGPLVATTAEVVAWVRDRPRLEAEFGPAVAAFNERFNRFQDGHAAERVVDWLDARDSLPG